MGQIRETSKMFTVGVPPGKGLGLGNTDFRFAMNLRSTEKFFCALLMLQTILRGVVYIDVQ